MKITITKGGCWFSNEQLQLQYNRDEIINNYARNIIKGHKERGFEVTITLEEMKERIKKAMNEPCPYCGERMEYHWDGTHRNSITADIIDPEVRCVSDKNLQFICNSCNSMKAFFNEDEFIQRCTLISNKFNAQYI